MPTKKKSAAKRQELVIGNVSFSIAKKCFDVFAAQGLSPREVSLQDGRQFVKLNVKLLDGDFQYAGRTFVNIENHYSIYAMTDMHDDMFRNHLSCTFILKTDVDKAGDQLCETLKVRVYTTNNDNRFVGTATLTQGAKRDLLPRQSVASSTRKLKSGRKAKHKQQGAASASAAAPQAATESQTQPLFRSHAKLILSQLTTVVLSIESTISNKLGEYEARATDIVEAVNRLNAGGVGRINHALAELRDIQPYLHVNYFRLCRDYLDRLKQSLLQLPDRKVAADDVGECAEFEEKAEKSAIRAPLFSSRSEEKNTGQMQETLRRLIDEINASEDCDEQCTKLRELESHYSGLIGAHSLSDGEVLDLECQLQGMKLHVLYTAAVANRVDVIEQQRLLLRSHEIFWQVMLIATLNVSLDVLAFGFRFLPRAAHLMMFFGDNVQESVVGRYGIASPFVKRSLFAHAVEMDNADIANFFIQKGYPLNLLFSSGGSSGYFSELDVALYRGKSQVVDALLEAGASVDKEGCLILNGNMSRYSVAVLPLSMRIQMKSSYAVAISVGGVELLAKLRGYKDNPWYEGISASEYAREGVAGDIQTGFPALLIDMARNPEVQEAIVKDNEMKAYVQEMMRLIPDDDQHATLGAALSICCQSRNYEIANMLLNVDGVQIAEPDGACHGPLTIPLPDSAACNLIYRDIRNEACELTPEQLQDAQQLFLRICEEDKGTVLSFIVTLVNVLERKGDLKEEHPRYALLQQLEQALMNRIHLIFQVPNEAATSGAVQAGLMGPEQWLAQNEEKVVANAQALNTRRNAVYLHFVVCYFYLTSDFLTDPDNLKHAARLMRRCFEVLAEPMLGQASGFVGRLINSLMDEKLVPAMRAHINNPGESREGRVMAEIFATMLGPEGERPQRLHDSPHRAVGSTGQDQKQIAADGAIRPGKP